MASSALVSSLQESISQFLSLTKPKILRPELGVESSEEVLTPILEELYEKTGIMQQVLDYVGNVAVETVLANLNALTQGLASFSILSNQDYVAQKPTVLQNSQHYRDAIRNVWPEFFIAYLEHFPTKSEEQVSHSEAIALTEDIRAKSAAAEESLQALKLLIDETERIKKAAQKTAQGISILEAQQQFSRAQVNLYWKIGAATVGASIFFLWFFCLAFDFLVASKDLEDIWTWKIAYGAGIRTVILASIAAVASYFLTLLKAYLHLLEHNLHRQRVANSTEAFVAAAGTPEQRDLILVKLVESVTSFGDSGLLKATANENPATRLNFDISTKT